MRSAKVRYSEQECTHGVGIKTWDFSLMFLIAQRLMRRLRPVLDLDAGFSGAIDSMLKWLRIAAVVELTDLKTGLR